MYWVISALLTHIWLQKTGKFAQGSKDPVTVLSLVLITKEMNLRVNYILFKQGYTYP